MFGEKKKQDEAQSRFILGMVILQDLNSFETKAFRKDFKSNYKKTVDEPSGDASSFAFKIDGELIVVGYMPVPIPHGDLEGVAVYAYNWETALEDLKNHESHLIVSVTSGGQDQIKRFKIFTQVICSILRITNSVGVYKGTQSLLIPKNDYLEEAELMSDDYLPLNLWIYFGFRVSDSGNSSYTYGLKELNKTEMEIINSLKSIEQISTFLFNMTHYVLEYDVTFKDGQTCGMSADELIAISFSKGKFVEDNSFKLAY
ncbi:DUF4261 domain-containing protein [soil metagenome]